LLYQEKSGKPTKQGLFYVHTNSIRVSGVFFTNSSGHTDLVSAPLRSPPKGIQCWAQFLGNRERFLTTSFVPS
jgi:hypothetical protein